MKIEKHEETAKGMTVYFNMPMYHWLTRTAKENGCTKATVLRECVRRAMIEDGDPDPYGSES